MEVIFELDGESVLATQKQEDPQLYKKLSAVASELLDELDTKQLILTRYVWAGGSPLGWEVSNEAGVALYLLSEFRQARPPLSAQVVERYEDMSLALTAHLSSHGVTVSWAA